MTRGLRASASSSARRRFTVRVAIDVPIRREMEVGGSGSVGPLRPPPPGRLATKQTCCKTVEICHIFFAAMSKSVKFQKNCSTLPAPNRAGAAAPARGRPPVRSRHPSHLGATSKDSPFPTAQMAMIAVQGCRKFRFYSEVLPPVGSACPPTSQLTPSNRAPEAGDLILNKSATAVLGVNKAGLLRPVRSDTRPGRSVSDEARDDGSPPSSSGPPATSADLSGLID